MTDLSDPLDVRKRNREVAVAAKRRQEMVMAIMSMPQGREFVWEVLEWCRPFVNPFKYDALATAFACGEMNIGQRLIAAIQPACPDLYMQMTTEAGERDARRTGNDSGGGDDSGYDDGRPTGAVD
jgi:hypothetical protein